MTIHRGSAAMAGKQNPILSLYHLLDPEVLANPYPLYHRLRSEDPVHWDPFLHAWVVTRYAAVVTVFQRFSASRTPAPEQLTALGLSALTPLAQVMVRQMLFLFLLWRAACADRGPDRVRDCTAADAQFEPGTRSIILARKPGSARSSSPGGDILITAK